MNIFSVQNKENFGIQQLSRPTTIESSGKVSQLDVISDKSLAKRKSELFKRIKPSNVAHLLSRENSNSVITYSNPPSSKANVSELIQDKGWTSDIMLKNPHKITTPFKPNKDDAQSSISSLAYQTESRFSVKSTLSEQLQLDSNTEFLILDIRDPEDFELFHIKDALNLPGPCITRDKFVPQLYNFKNREGKIIIVYHLDERNGIPYAQTMIQKGYENTYLLSGGVEAFLEEFPSLVEGKKVPYVEPKPETKTINFSKKVDTEISESVVGVLSPQFENFEVIPNSEPSIKDFDDLKTEEVIEEKGLKESNLNKKNQAKNEKGKKETTTKDKKVLPPKSTFGIAKRSIVPDPIKTVTKKSAPAKSNS